jgi:hypothetical protein
MKGLPVDRNSYISPSKKNTPLKEETQEVKDKEGVYGFTSGGNPELPCPTCEVLLANGKPNPDCLAMKIVNNKLQEKFYVKVGVHGALFDPWGIFSEGTQNKYANLHGRPVWQFHQVNKKVFDLYKIYLQTRNQVWKINAERELNNG